MIFGNVKEAFPNLNLSIENNRFIMTIPIQDIIRFLENEIGKQLRNFKVEKYADGLLIRIDILSNLLPNYSNLQNKIIVEPEEVKIFIPYKSIIEALNIPDNVNKNISINEKEIKVEITLY